MKYYFVFYYKIEIEFWYFTISPGMNSLTN